MKELIVISGKGGTGKTSLVASFAALAGRAVLADCDVDAADLHLILDPKTWHRESFSGGKEARILVEECIACARCQAVCRFGAIRYDGPPSRTIAKTYRVEPIACEGCGVCVRFCPTDAIVFQPVVTGEWFVSETRHGAMVHARLRPGGENSGKLVTVVRTQARELAERDQCDLILVDGAPGIGCPVVASITGADMVLIVTEPTLSGLHDFERVHALVRHFGIPALLCVNKHDINPAISERIAATAERLGVRVVGTIPYDTAFTRAQLDGVSIVEYAGSSTADHVRRLWAAVARELGNGTAPEENV
ncbi:MAG: 4Fe-4S dicluster domain-containing protein [Verrucomicrobia bacterium]|nr:4Fe-4S dicluster domain-containing protein [Verrucomicrobiota bacterium]